MTFDVEDREAGDNTGVQGLLMPLIDGRMYSFGHDAADDSVDELVAEALLHLLELDDGVAVLTATAGLTDELALSLLDVVTSGLAVGNLGLPTLASTLNSRSRRSTIISRCSSPMPAMMVWPVSWLVDTWKVGSSSASLVRARDILSCSAFGLGLDGNVNNGLSELDLLEDDLLALGAQGVTGGGVLEADATTMSPAAASSRSIRSAAFISRMRPRRSR